MKYIVLVVIGVAFADVAEAIDPEKKSATASRTSKRPAIDGVLNDECWATAPEMSGFTQIEPNVGVASSKKTIIRIVYDDAAIVVGVDMKETYPDSILRELTARDDIGNADWFGVFIDAYQDGINGVGFLVTASGVQNDFKYSVFGEDVSWNSVWQSAVKINKDGWTAEIRIPYSALRFPDRENQQWHINFIRYARATREKASWNFINPTVSGFLNQSGYLNGVTGIKPPLRLQLFPYISSYYNISGKEKATSVNGGLDVKYGLSDAFTLDMTLVPDFGQVQSDNQVLNLSPFEVKFQENRQFFTEGTELFNKGDLFYSRRIGETPFNYGSINDSVHNGEKLLTNPSSSTLVNATKVSGRTSKGLGVGVFNAVTRNTFATIGTAEGGERRELSDPSTNYNVFVLDQNFRSNSYVTFINTNVTRAGSYYDANVTGTQFNIHDKKIRYSISGFGAVSQQYGLRGKGVDTYGTTHRAAVSKVSGNFTGSIGYNMTSDRYDPNDLGFLLFNNTIEKYINASYSIFKPFGKFNRATVSSYVTHTQIYNPRAFNNLGAGADAFFMLKSFHAFGGFVNSEPITTYDYFETRRYGRYYTYPVNYSGGAWISSDYRKRFAFDVDASYKWFDETARATVQYSISPRFRVNNKLSFVYSYSVNDQQNDVGYAVPNQIWYDSLISGTLNYPFEDVIFGIRDRKTITHLFTTKYTFNNKMGLTFRLRHYWSKVKYNSLHLLDQDGMLAETDYSGRDAAGNSYHDNSYNAFNIDMVYSWVFSPGSELRLVWKNSIYSSEDRVFRDYQSNVRYVFDQLQTNSFSVKFLYFLDSSMLRKKA
ncbi:MAG: DUF5916 domain-containing protein [Bacteroidota bacterium]